MHETDAAVDAHEEVVHRVAREIHARPELNYQERFAAELIASEIERAGIRVERGAHGIATSFRAEVGTGGPAIAILAEYDALPEIGHACGHNLIAASALGAFLALREVAERARGRVVLLGAPAEEGGGGKVKLVDAGAFTGIDAAMMYHPHDRSVIQHASLAMQQLDAVFRGRAAHASGRAHEGASALRAVIAMFNLVDSARLHLRDELRVHGIITDGGKAPNIIPERAACSFMVRAPVRQGLEEVLAVVERSARAAADATGTTVELAYGPPYHELRTNAPLAQRFAAALAALGIAFTDSDPVVGRGSTDMGNVSHVVPAIHPMVAVCERDRARPHQAEFTAVTISDGALDAAVVAAKALARVAAEFLDDATLRADVRAAFTGISRANSNVGD